MSRTVASPLVMIVDDDCGTREIFSCALSAAGIGTVSAATAADAIGLTRAARTFAAAVIDLRLPDMSGLDLVRALRRADSSCPFMLVSAFLTTRATVEAMRLGAAEVLEKPIEIETLCATVTRMSTGTPAASGTGATDRLVTSVVGRLAGLVWAVVDAAADPATLGTWARVAGVSYSSLRELCRIADIDARNVRDLTRMLRAVTCARRYKLPPTAFLAVHDVRTLRNLFDRAGIQRDDAHVPEYDAFLRGQQFIDIRHPVAQALLALRSRRNA